MLEATEIGRKLAALQAIGFSPSNPEPFHNPVRLDRDSWHTHTGRPALGSFVDVTVIDRSPDRAGDAIDHALAELERLAQLYDRRRGDTAIAELNAQRRLQRAPLELLALLGQSRWYTMISGGAFDVTVAPLVDLFRATRANGEHEPAQQDVAAVRALIGGDALSVSPRSVSLRREGAAVTLDGIAKGSIVDGMARVLTRHKLRRWLINAGGDLRASGTNERGEPWVVAVRDPAGPRSLAETIRLRNGAVATSGCHELVNSADLSVHEIVDGARGLAPRCCATVTVVAPSAAAADALATAAFVLGPGAGTRLIEQLRCACLTVLPDGSLHR
ncbi:MAG: FAD:protein FMN transferase, partial [Gemmatimonadales bacterium]